ncbi:MAG: P1 family peptidase [Thermoplasmata archaeon]|nr:P1 family peptidase [Thermoplasmata archaeon]
MTSGSTSGARGLRGVRIGHAESADRSTGVSVILFGQSAPTVVDVRGGASGTYDTASLSLDATFGRRWAVFFTGGSLFGLDAAAGLRDAILEEGGGHSVFRNPNRIAPVSGAVLYDLPNGRRPAYDYRALGAAAAANAEAPANFAGRIGAGAGARVGKYLGRSASQPGALAVAVDAERGLGSVAVLAVLNSVGAIRDPRSGRWIAGARNASGRIVPPGAADRPNSAGTTLVAVVTDVSAPRTTLQRVAAFAHTGLARAVSPAHTATDGDTVFVSGVGSHPAGRWARPGTVELGDRLGMLAERATVRAIVAAAHAAGRVSRSSAVATGSREDRG